MKTYQLSISINDNGKELNKKLELRANDADELSQKLNALKVLNNSVEHEDLIATMELIHEKPDLVPVIKNMLNEGETLSEGQLMLRLPKYVKQVLKVLKS